MSECINLRERFGDKHKIGADEAAETWAERRDPWMMQMPCIGRGVTIYPHGGTTLAVEVNGRPMLSSLLKRLDGIIVYQDGGGCGDMTFLFDVAMFERVAEIVKPRMRVRLSDEERQRRAARMSEVRNKKHGPSEQRDAIPVGDGLTVGLMA